MRRSSYVNVIPPDGGTHVNGFNLGLGRSYDYADKYKLLKDKELFS
jgi:DNA gyrase/topoisomerase IV subunit B